MDETTEGPDRSRQGHHEKGHHHTLINYKVDDEPELTDQPQLSAREVMRLAGVDAETNYLSLLIPGHESQSFREDPGALIRMSEGMCFITKPIGEMPVSAN